MCNKESSMGIIHQKNKRTGITYVYENEAYWDKDKQQSRAKRKLIGKLDPETREIIPTQPIKNESGKTLSYYQNQAPFLFEKFADAFTENDHLTSLYNDLSNNTQKEYRLKDYSRYFDVTETPKRGRKIKPREDAMRQVARNYGFFALLSNEIKEPFEALSLYRSKDIAEKAFWEPERPLKL